MISWFDNNQDEVQDVCHSIVVFLLTMGAVIVSIDWWVMRVVGWWSCLEQMIDR